MSNLTSTAPAAFDAFLALITAAAAADNVSVVDSELVQYEPGTYVELQSIAEHEFEMTGLGYVGAYETYELVGVVRVFQGNIDPKKIRDTAWAAYQKYVMTPVVNNRQLGVDTDSSSTVLYCVPKKNTYVGEITDQGGFQGVVEFAYLVRARITT